MAIYYPQCGSFNECLVHFVGVEKRDRREKEKNQLFFPAGLEDNKQIAANFHLLFLRSKEK